MSDEQKLQIKRAILSELNKELSKKNKNHVNRKKNHPVPDTGQTHTTKRKESNAAAPVPSTAPVKLHKPRPLPRKFDAQEYSGNLPAKSTLKKSGKRVTIPNPTPRDVRCYEAEPCKFEHIRKFAELWYSKTFGKNPEIFRKAVLYHDTKLLQSCITKWKSASYSKQNDWKLVVRADCHYRFYLKEKYWDCWRRFASHNRSMAEKKIVADEFCERLLLKRYLNFMKCPVAHRKEVNANKSVANCVFERNLARKFFNQWLRKLADRHIAHQQEDIALHFWSLSLQRDCFSQWMKYKDRQVVKRGVNAVISNFYHGKLVQHSFKQWVLYRRHRKCKEIDKKKAVRLYKSNAEHKFFHVWNEQAFISIKTKKLELQMSAIRERFKARCFFIQWRYFCQINEEKRSMKEIADSQYRRTLLVTSLQGLIAYNRHQKRTEELKQVAASTRKRNILSHHMKRWVLKLDEAEESKLKFRTLMARKHYEHKIMRECLAKLLDYKEYRLDRKECYKIADTHYEVSIVQLMFTNWHLYLSYRRTVKVKKETAEMHYNELLNVKFFYIWNKQYHLSCNRRQDERIAVIHHERSVLKKWFSTWRELRQENKADYLLSARADDHYRCKLKQRAISALSKNRDRNQWKRIETEKARAHLEKKLVTQCFGSWIDYSKSRKVSQKKRSIASDHYDKSMMLKFLKCWKDHHSVIAKARSVVQSVHHQLNQRILHKVLMQWSSRVQIHKIATNHHLRAEFHYRQLLQRKVLGGWLAFTEQRARDHVSKTIMLEEGHCLLDKLKLRQTFIQWRKRTHEKQREDLQWSAAVSHYQRSLLNSCFRGLQVHVEVNFKKVLLHKKCDIFLSEHLVKRHVSKWKCSLAAQLTENANSERALWFWCVSLEHRVLRAWLSYTLYRRNKRRQYREALEDRRRYHLQTGIRLWIENVVSSDEMRTQTALNALTQQTIQANKSALKWGRHWLDLVRKKSSKQLTIISGGYQVTRSCLATKDVAPVVASVSSVARSNTETPKFYEGIKALKTTRPAPKIPSFFVQKQYCQ